MCSCVLVCGCPVGEGVVRWLFGRDGFRKLGLKPIFVKQLCSFCLHVSLALAQRASSLSLTSPLSLPCTTAATEARRGRQGEGGGEGEGGAGASCEESVLLCRVSFGCPNKCVLVHEYYMDLLI